MNPYLAFSPTEEILWRVPISPDGCAFPSRRSILFHVESIVRSQMSELLRRIVDCLVLLLSTSKFVDREVRHIRELRELEKGAWADPEEDRHEFRRRVENKRFGVAVSAALVLLVIVAGAVSGFVADTIWPISGAHSRLLKAISIGIVAWAVLSRLGYESETWKGKTLLETTSLTMFKSTYLFGLYLTTLSVVWPEG